MKEHKEDFLELNAVEMNGATDKSPGIKGHNEGKKEETDDSKKEL